MTFPAVHQCNSNVSSHAHENSPMDEYQSLSHTTWDCKYHVVFIPKCRRRTLYLELRRHLGEVFHKLAMQRNPRSKKAI